MEFLLHVRGPQCLLSLETQALSPPEVGPVRSSRGVEWGCGSSGEEPGGQGSGPRSRELRNPSRPVGGPGALCPLLAALCACSGCPATARRQGSASSKPRPLLPLARGNLPQVTGLAHPPEPQSLLKVPVSLPRFPILLIPCASLSLSGPLFSRSPLFPAQLNGNPPRRAIQSFPDRPRGCGSEPRRNQGLRPGARLPGTPERLGLSIEECVFRLGAIVTDAQCLSPNRCL